MSDIYGGAFTGKVSTSSSSLNVRQTASTTANIYEQLAKGSTHTFGSYYQHNDNSYARSWLLYYPNGANTPAHGYVSARYITWLPSYGYGGCTETTVVVDPDEYVNLRLLPSKSSDSIYHLHNNDPVLVLETHNVPVNGWTHIATAGGTGWIMTEFLALRG